MGWDSGSVLTSAPTFAPEFAAALRVSCKFVQMEKQMGMHTVSSGRHLQWLLLVHQEGQLLDNAPMLNQTLNDTVIFF